MRLVTFATDAQAPAVGVIVNDEALALGASKFPDMTTFLAGGTAAFQEAGALTYTRMAKFIDKAIGPIVLMIGVMDICLRGEHAP